MKSLSREIIKIFALSFLPLLVLFNFIFYISFESQFQSDVKRIAASKLRLIEFALEKEASPALSKKKIIDVLENFNFSKSNLLILDSLSNKIFDWQMPVSDGKNIFSFLNREEIFRLKNGMIAREQASSDRTLFTYFSVVKIAGKRAILEMDFYCDSYGNHMKILFWFLFAFDALALLSFAIFLTASRKYFKRQIFLLRDVISGGPESKGKNLPEEFQEISFFHKLAIGQKVQEIKSVENKLEELRSALDQISEGVALFGEAFTLEFCNESFRKILGRSKKEFNVGEEVFNFVEFPPLLLDLKNFRENRVPINASAKYYGGKFLEYSILPLGKDGGEAAKFVIVVKDVTTIKRLERIRKDFVANVSHEFKTPLTSIRGYAETLLSGGGDAGGATRQKFLEKIYNQTFRLENLVNDLLKLNKIENEAGADFDYFPVNKVIREIADDFEIIAKKKGLIFETNILLKETVKIKGEENLLNVILTNLLMNAVQYSSEGGRVVLNVSADEQKLKIEVQDEGIGIAPNELERIFERFYRTNGALRMFREGTGLGLSLVKHAAELLGGRISVKSQPGKGSVFLCEITGVF